MAFSDMLAVATQFTAMRPIAEIPASAPANSSRTNSQIISSIELNKEEAIFATAGVSQRIALYNCDDLLTAAGGAPPAPPQRHQPVKELTAQAKLSCLSFNAVHNSQMLSSDYNGMVMLWDVETAQCMQEYNAHISKIWSVHFSPVEAERFVSGGADGQLKVLSSKQRC